MNYRILFLVIAVLLVVSLAYADVPKLINFQGRLTDSSGKFVPDGNYSVTFRIYTVSSGGTARWTEVRTVSVTRGLFNIILGENTSIPDSIFNYTDTWLGIQVASDPEMAPRQRISSLGYSYKSLKSDTANYARAAVADGDWTISGNDIYRLNGNVGIGTSSPDVDLYVRRGSNNVRIWARNDSASGYSELTALNNGGNGIIVRAFGSTHASKANVCELTGGGDSIDDLRINAWGDDDYITFHTNNIEKMRITTEGNVGIGTTSPDKKLHIGGGGQTHTQTAEGIYVNPNAASVSISAEDNTGVEGGIMSHNNGNVYMGSWSNHPIRLRTNNYDRLMIDVSGNVGIGTMSPERDLDIFAENPNLRLTGTSGGPTITLDKPSGGYWEYLEFREAGASKWQAGVSSGNNFYILNWPASEYVFYANNSGDVGIGTTSPSYKLDVNGDINVAGSYNIKKGGTDYTHPDYVFEPDYKLMSFEELKKYVFEHKSLPNVISAEDVKKNNGFKMDELLVQMLEKIEEQTLYIFQLEERIVELEKHQQQ